MKFKTVIRCAALFIVITVTVVSETTTAPSVSSDQHDLNVVDFNFLADRMAMLARVLTGISLQNGLADGSISEDEVMPELLKIPFVTMNDVENFDKEKVDEYLLNLNNIRNLENGSLNLEEDICLMKKYEELWSKADGFLKTDMKIFDELEEWKTFEFWILMNDFQPRLSLISDTSNWPNDYSTSDISSNYVESVLNDTWNSLGPLNDAIDFLANIKSRKMLLPWNKLGSVPSRLEKVRCFSEAVYNADHYSQLNNRTLDKKEKEALMENIKRVENIPFDSGTHFKVMGALSSRFLPQLDQQFPGFINGYHDLKRLMEDSSSSSLLKSLNMTIPIGNVSQTFSSFVENVSLLGDNSSSVSNRSLYQSVARVIQLQESFKKFNGFSERYQESIQAIEKCMKMSQHSKSDWHRFSNYLPKLKFEFEALTAVLNFLNDAQIRNFKELMKIINTAPKGESTRKTITTSADKLKQFSGTKDAIDFVENILPLLKPFKEGSGFDNMVYHVHQGRHLLSDFNETPLVLMRVKYFKCLSGIRTELQKYSDIIGFFDTLRHFKTDQVISDIRMVSNQIADSLPAVNSVRLKLEQADSKPMRSGMEMMKWSNLTNTTKSFGRAVAGVVAIQEVMNNIFSFEIAVSGWKVVHQAFWEIPATIVRERVQKAWGDFEATTRSIQKLIDQLKLKAKEAARIREGTNLKLTDYQEFFTSLSGIDDVDLDIDRKLDALDRLVDAVPATWKRVEIIQKTLKEIGNLDLNFSKYTKYLLRTTKTLPAIQIACEPTIKITEATPIRSPLQHDFTATLNTDYEWVPTFIYTMFSIILVGILGVITLMIYRECLIRKYEEDEKQEEKRRERIRKRTEKRVEVDMGRHLLGDLMGDPILENEAPVSDLEKSAEPKKSVELKEEATQRSDQEELKPVKTEGKKETKPSNAGGQQGAASRLSNPIVVPTPPPNREQKVEVEETQRSEQATSAPPKTELKKGTKTRKKKGGAMIADLGSREVPTFPNPIVTPTPTPPASHQTSRTPASSASSSHRP